ncbi:MAG: MFS transporter [Pseudomonadota bacterium]
MTTTAELEGRSDWGAIAATTFAGIAVATLIGKMSAAIPLIREDLGTGLSLLGTLAALISLVAAVAGLFFGVAARRIGPRRAVTLGLLAAALGSALGAGAGSVGLLLLLRGVEAAGFALVVAAGPALVQSRAAARDRALSLGIWGIWIPLGVAAILLVAALGGAGLGWRGLYLVSAGILVLSALWVRVAVPPDAALSVPRFRFATLARRRLMLTIAAFAAFGGANMIMLAFLPTLLIDLAALPLAWATAAAIVSSLLIMPGNVLGGWMIGRQIAAGPIILFSLVAMGLTSIMVLGEGWSIGARIGAAAAFSLACGFAPGAIWGSIPALATVPDEAPVISGLLFQGAGLGQILGPFIIGVVVEGAGAWQAGLSVMLAFVGVGVITALALMRGGGDEAAHGP